MLLKSAFVAKRFSLSAVFAIFLIGTPHASAANNITENAQVSKQKQVVNSGYHLGNSPINLVTSRLPVLPATLNLVKQSEGFRSRAYIDTSGLPVIGYGQSRINGKKVRMGQYITRAQANAALEKELYHIQNMVLAHVKVDLNPHQLGALTSLVYNAGTRVVRNSTLVRKLNAGDYVGASREFVRWNKANRRGRLVAFPGLTKRRLAETQLFLTPYGQMASNSSER